MPLAPDHDLSKVQFLQEDATGHVFRACNCSSAPPNRTLRFAARNRQLFSAWPPKAQTPSAPKAPEISSEEPIKIGVKVEYIPKDQP